jgi:hypothetical protein
MKMTPIKSTLGIISKASSIKIFWVAFTSFFCFSANAAHAVSCNASTTLDSLWRSTGNNECTVTPDFVKLGLFQFGLCTEMPTYTDISMCDFILDGENATILNLGINSSGDLPGASQKDLDQTLYTHAFMVIDNSVFVKDSFQFDTARKSSDGSQGEICWTNGQPNGFFTDSPSDNGVTCGSIDNAVDTEASYRYFEQSGNYVASVTNSLGTTNLYALVQGLAPSALATTDENGSYIMMAQEMLTSVDMTGNPPLNISFKVTDAAKLSFYDGSASRGGVNFCTDTSQPCVGNIEVNTLDVRVSIK